jgi:hypothetical protein
MAACHPWKCGKQMDLVLVFKRPKLMHRQEEEKIKYKFRAKVYKLKFLYKNILRNKIKQLSFSRTVDNLGQCISVCSKRDIEREREREREKR